MTYLLSALDPRLRCAVPVFGTAFLDRALSGDEDTDVFFNLTPAQKRDWLADYDPCHYLKFIRHPMLFVGIPNDGAFGLDVVRATRAALPDPMALSIRPDLSCHSQEHGETAEEIALFVEHHLSGGPALPQLGPMTHVGRRVRATARTVDPFEAHLVYTTQSGPRKHRRWQRGAATTIRSEVHAEVPDDATSWYLSIEDARGAWISTPHRDADERT